MSAINNSQSPSASSKSAKTSGKPVKSIAILGLLLIAFSAVAVFQDATKVKLGLDLRGGTSVTLTPRATEGAKVTPEAISQAVEIIRQRVNSIGVAESEVAAQGSGNNRQIVISVPGETGEEIVQLVGQTAELRFRQVLVQGAPNATSVSGDPQNASLPSGVSPELSAKFAALDCTNKINLQGGSTESPDVAVVSCDRGGTGKYILAPAQVLGNMVSKATAAIDQQGAAGLRLFRLYLDSTFSLYQSFYCLPVFLLVFGIFSFQKFICLADGHSKWPLTPWNRESTWREFVVRLSC